MNIQVLLFAKGKMICWPILEEVWLYTRTRRRNSRNRDFSSHPQQPCPTHMEKVYSSPYFRSIDRRMNEVRHMIHVCEKTDIYCTTGREHKTADLKLRIHRTSTSLISSPMSKDGRGEIGSCLAPYPASRSRCLPIEHLK
jgi:hypothetical protein